VLEPIDDVKVQVQMNTNTMIQIKNMVDLLMKESAEAMERDEKILKAIEELKEDVKKNKKVTPTSTSFYHRYHPDMSNMIKEFVVKFEGTPTDQSEA